MATRDSSLNHHKFMQYSLPDLMSMANSRNTAAQGQPAQFDMTDLGLGPGTIQNGQLYFPKGSVTDNGNHARYITDNGQGGTGINDVQNSKGFLGDLAGFKGLEGKNFLKEIGSNPSRLLTGIDPFSTKLWNKALGTNNNALVDQMGGATPQRFKDAEAAGINTGAGRTTEGIAHAVASLYAGGALAGLAGGGAAAGAGVGEGAGTIGAHGAFTALDAAGLPAAAGVAPMGLVGALPNVAGGGLLAGGAGLGAAAAGGGASSGAALGGGNSIAAIGSGGLPAAAGVAPMGVAGAIPATGAGTAAGAGGLLSGDTLKSAVKLAPTALSALGAVKSLTGNSTSQQTATTQNKLDPRVDNIIFGNQQKQLKPGAVPTGEDANGRPIYKPEDYITTGNQGLLDRYQGFLDQKQTPGANLYGQTSDNFAGLNALKDMNAVRDSSYKLMNGNQAPQMTAAQSGAPSRMQAAQGMASQTELPNGYNVTNANHSMSDAASSNAASANAASMQAAHINAPGQNNLNLTDAYDKFINGESGNNPYLTGAIQKGINQSKTAFENMQTDATRNLTEKDRKSVV